MENQATVEPTKPEEQPEVKTRSLAVRDDGSLALNSLEDQLQFAQRLIKQGMVSESFKTPQQVVIAFQYAKALAIPELLAVKMMYVVNGKPSLFAEGPLSLVQRNQAFWKIREFFIDSECNEICLKNKNLKSEVYGAVTEVWRKGDDQPQVDFFTKDDLARAKLDQGRNGKKDIWDKWERIMMRYKARAIALRSKFADLIAGVPISEYDFDFTPEMPEVGPSRPGKTTAAADLVNREYGEETQDQGQETSKVS